MPGRSRTTTPAAARRSRVAARVGVLPGDERGGAARRDRAAALGRARRRAGRPARWRGRARRRSRRRRARGWRRARTPPPRARARRCRSGGRRRAGSASKPAWLSSKLMKLGPTARTRSPELRLDVQQPGAVGPAQPLLAGGGVGGAAQRVDVDRHGAGALRAVEHDRHVELGQRGGRELAGDPRDVRAGDERGARGHGVGDVAQRDGPDRRAAARGRRAAARSARDARCRR